MEDVSSHIHYSIHTNIHLHPHLVHGSTLSEHRSEGREVGDDGPIEVDTAVMEVSAHLVGEGRNEEEWKEEEGEEGRGCHDLRTCK